jgi:outer membrane lipoprotein carrier protein
MMKFMRAFFQSLMVFTLLSGAVWADTATDRLDYFFKSVGSLTSNFTQTVRDEKGDLVREAKGTFALLRPGRFRWDYTAPNEQSIISDGQYLWIYDKELAQVMGSSPILLLSEPRAVKEDFVIAETYEANGLSWVELFPKVKDTDFNKILVGLNNEGVKEMQLFDQFGQHTTIRFDQVRINQPLQASRFSFVIPPGVDVIGLDRN